MGELIDHAARFWRAHVRELFGLYLPFQLVVYGLTKAASLAVYRLPLLAAPRMAQAIQDGRGLEVFRQAVFAAGVFVLLFAVAVGLSWWINVAGSHFVVERVLGRGGPMSASVARAKGRLGSTAAAFLLSCLMGAAAALVCALPGLTLVGAGVASRTHLAVALMVLGAGVFGLGELVALLWFILRFMVTAQVIALEDLGPWAAIRRSGQLVSGKVGAGWAGWVKVRATVLLTATFLIITAVSIVAGLPAMAVTIAYGHPFYPLKSDPGAIPQALLVPCELVNVAAQAVFAPIYLVFAALFYLDMRVRREGNL